MARGHKDTTKRRLEKTKPSETAMKLRYCLALAAAVVFAPAAYADSFSPQQKQDLGPLIRDYLVSHPEVLREAIDALDKHDKQAAEEQRLKAVADDAGVIYRSKFQADVGNPQGN